MKQTNQPFDYTAFFVMVFIFILVNSCSNEKTSDGNQPGVSVLLVDTDRKSRNIEEDIYGQFLEHINHSVEDGLFAEQIQGQGYHFLIPFYRAIRDKQIADQNEKEIIWKHFMKYLVSENCYSDPISYVLWVEFFEDDTTVRETWQGLVNNNSDRTSLLRLLEVAAPVPFELKVTLYNRFLTDTDTHEIIFDSLLHSAYEVFGKIDKKRSLNILAKLQIDTTTEKYKLLQEKLK